MRRQVPTTIAGWARVQRRLDIVVVVVMVVCTPISVWAWRRGHHLLSVVTLTAIIGNVVVCAFRHRDHTRMIRNVVDQEVERALEEER